MDSDWERAADIAVEFDRRRRETAAMQEEDDAGYRAREWDNVNELLAHRPVQFMAMANEQAGRLTEDEPPIFESCEQDNFEEMMR